MALPENHPISETVVSARLADISTAGSCFAVAPVKGRIVRAYSVIEAAISAADCTWVMQINGATVVGSTTTVTQSGSAPGDVDVSVPTGSNQVDEGDDIAFVSAGESSGVAAANFFAVIRP